MRRINIRTQSGFSLPTMLALGVVGGLWIVGTAAFVIPSMGRLNHERLTDSMRCSAEAGLDWAVQQMNIPSQRASMEAAGQVAIPSTLIADNEGKYHLSGQVTVANVVPVQGATYLYDPLTDPNHANANIMGGNGWRVITATVQNGAGTVQRQVRVILKPVYETTGPGGAWQNVNGWGPPQNMFAFAMFAPGVISGVGNANTRDYDSSNPGLGFDTKKGSLASNTKVALGGNSTVGGDLNVFSTPKGSTTYEAASGGPNVTVKGNLNTNGASNGIGDSQVDGQFMPSNANGGDPVTLPPVPTAPAGSTNLGAINVSGNNTYTISQPGNYIVSSIKVSGNGNFKITANGKVNIYVQGASASIDITGNGITNQGGIPGNLRLWYGGSSTVKIAGNGNMHGVVYAPNAPVQLSGNGGMYGAVVGSTIGINGNGQFTYDRALGSDSDFEYRNPVVNQVWVPSSAPPAGIDHYQAVSWDERELRQN